MPRRGGNATGLADIQTEITGKRLELLKEALTEISRVGTSKPTVAGRKCQTMKVRRVALTDLTESQAHKLRLLKAAPRGPDDDP